MQVSEAIPEYEIVAPKEALISWKHDQVTKQVLEIVEKEIHSSEMRLGNGETLGELVAQNTGRAVGYCEGLKFLQSILELQDVVENKEDADDAEKDSDSIRKLRNSKT